MVDSSAMQVQIDQVLSLDRLGELRLTPQRRAVLAAVLESEEHLTAALIYDRVRRQLPKIGYGTVYAALHYLVQEGLITEVRRSDGVIAFDRRLEHHDHVTCRRCGRLTDIEACAVPSSYDAIVAKTGYLIEGHTVEFLGLCPSCQAELEATKLERQLG